MTNELDWFFLIVTFIIGTVIGSFLNVVIYRLPREKSVVTPPSACGSCETELKWNDLIPLISYILLKGRCRYCEESFSIRYPLIELLNGLSYLLIYLAFGPTITAVAYMFLLSVLIAVVYIDLDFMIIPDKLMLTAFIAGIPLTLLQSLHTFTTGLIGALVGGGILLLIAILSKGGMGGGDIKLAAVLGLYLGWPQILLILFLSFFIGAIAGIAIVLRKGKTMKEAIPFGPYLALAAVIVIFWGPQLLNLYKSFYW
ncbi:prepilin peptidase [Heliorestis acidaminivorans]|uniref:Prepilin leader peptidase/N-methyltransferase n=1 Tax=Heliorestis acidaminivorans TaxID=553427 RepID=A0A6I0EXK0_9FIRM|nr:A24 family peptidase [Heliorestis acidaminivorans]KAB2951307.1 prepilin peptidase [Heliorestis acidaminivorans]